MQKNEKIDLISKKFAKIDTKNGKNRYDLIS